MTDPQKIKTQDRKIMLAALHLAAKGHGSVSPNPMVGCVIVKNGKILATGYHKKYGGPHAEVVALQKSKNSAVGSTLYVTLEPCHHFGKTPPCVDAILQAGVKRVVIAMRDPNPLTAGQSIRKLKKHGVQVTVGVCRQEAQILNRGFSKFIQTGMPYVIVKVAQSHDGKIAVSQGVRTQITGRVSQKYVQELRKTVDAVLVGRKTVAIDDPMLTVRNKVLPQPARVVLDSQLRTAAGRHGGLPLQSRLFTSAGGPVILCAAQNIDPKKLKRFRDQNVQVLLCATNKNGQLLWKDVLAKLAKENGILSVLVEGGAEILQSLSQTNCIDEWHQITAPQSLGEKGVALTAKPPRYLQPKRKVNLKNDVLLVFRNTNPNAMPPLTRRRIHFQCWNN